MHKHSIYVYVCLYLTFIHIATHGAEETARRRGRSLLPSLYLVFD